MIAPQKSRFQILLFAALALAFGFPISASALPPGASFGHYASLGVKGLYGASESENRTTFPMGVAVDCAGNAYASFTVGADAVVRI